MADTCIVCLGDLAGNENDAQRISEPSDPSSPSISYPGQVDLYTIAHLLPCRHNLHNDCLKPWVERANSCPICRQNFNMVELSSTLQGPKLASYAVEDKLQTAEVDPTLVVDDDLFEDEPEIEPCIVCEEYGDDEVLLLCDGCNSSCHTFCCDLDAVPAGAWFCQFCQEDGTQAPPRFSRQRTRGQQRRLGSRRVASPSPWARVWQSVWDGLNLDLDFPFPFEEESSIPQRNVAQQRDFEQWQRRFRVAERQGGAARFRDTAITLLDSRARGDRGASPQPESQEELRAWNAFEKAKELRSGPSSNGRKRKSPTASPVEPSPQPERKLKRPRTRRAQDSDTLSEQFAKSSSSKPVSATEEFRSTRPNLGSAGVGPSFLQSLLKEVESPAGAGNDSPNETATLNIVTTYPIDNASPSSPSPVSSPTSSNHPSPGARSNTPPPFHISRPTSPPLTSRIEPIFAQHPDFSPFSPVDRSSPDREELPPSPSINARNSRLLHRSSPSSSRQHSRDMSPSKGAMTLAAKAEIQQMVKTALRPLYNKKEIDKEQYTDINRDVSRKLYDRVRDADGLKDHKERHDWQHIAFTEVENAITVLKGDIVK